MQVEFWYRVNNTCERMDVSVGGDKWLRAAEEIVKTAFPLVAVYGMEASDRASSSLIFSTEMRGLGDAGNCEAIEPHWLSRQWRAVGV